MKTIASYHGFTMPFLRMIDFFHLHNW